MFCRLALVAQKGTTVAVPHLGGCSILHIWNAWTPTVTSMMYVRLDVSRSIPQ